MSAWCVPGAVYSSILKDDQIKNKNSFSTNFIWNVILPLFCSIISREEKNIFTTYVLHTPRLVQICVEMFNIVKKTNRKQKIAILHAYIICKKSWVFLEI